MAFVQIAKSVSLVLSKHFSSPLLFRKKAPPPFYLFSIFLPTRQFYPLFLVKRSCLSGSAPLSVSRPQCQPVVLSFLIYPALDLLLLDTVHCPPLRCWRSVDAPPSPELYLIWPFPKNFSDYPLKPCFAWSRKLPEMFPPRLGPLASPSDPANRRILSSPPSHRAQGPPRVPPLESTLNDASASPQT